MAKLPVIAIFDIGKTNKKLLLFDEHYKVVHEESQQLEETTDEDGFACEDVLLLTNWVKATFEKVLQDERFQVKAVNFSAYGASFVYLDKNKEVILPLYNYLKPYAPELQKFFYDTYGGESMVSKETASPVLGNLNSGMQLYRLRYEKPEKFAQINYALHLPQYLCFVLSGTLHTDITSIGCHTNLWDFQEKKYHEWVIKEHVAEKFAPILKSNAVAGYTQEEIPVGGGLHDSSSALIPYLASFHEPFVLLSTGTWCITLNPFNHSQLSDLELHQDCLCYLSYEGNPVKASRLFAGYEHEQQTKRLAEYFNVANDYYKQVEYNPAIVQSIIETKAFAKTSNDEVMIKESAFANRELLHFSSYEHAYHQLIADLITQQVYSTNLVLKGTKVKRIFVDGGFGKNPIFMHMLADAFTNIEVFAASVAQASSLGAALAFHKNWNTKALPTDIIELKYYSESK
ncbi:sugar (pentulose or hexulose) kinase [Lacibacter cauensis]|uniref:Sugar (Pentulose or hexulose) kinase n=1 Tax=Lacibacter cauensis TaxID=510947 RepID=A0A562SW35_9BACT|nr:FGGY family carbohydrate kinase [Lacibacter cauensis]TWI85442.1 sugar (pentulose or hexulose) kinase [Lacibacter cauensis]